VNNLIYIIKNKLFKISKEANKIKRPSYVELIKYQDFNRTDDNKLALGFSAGRSGSNWFSKLFNSHPNWIGTCERFADYEAFYRYVSYYNLPINKDNFFKLIELSSKRDMSKYQNSFISSSYLSFGVHELTKQLDPDYIFFNIRDPKKCVESLFKKGWYLFYEDKRKIKSPLFDITNNQYRSFSRIIPKDDFLEEWLSLSRIGKIAWYWSTINKSIKDDFDKIQNTKKYFVKLSDVDQNFEAYLSLVKKLNFKNVLSKGQFYNVINKASNKGKGEKYFYKNWNSLEKKEFEKIIDKFFPYYDEIITNI
tara:strand:- start:215 stop:1138 length:924 start_codon:yes stop_codon:yes gene_type:complete